MTTLREDMMDMLRQYRKDNQAFAAEQPKDSVEKMEAALRYLIKSESTDILAMRIHAVLAKHGL